MASGSGVVAFVCLATSIALHSHLALMSQPAHLLNQQQDLLNEQSGSEALLIPENELECEPNHLSQIDLVINVSGLSSRAICENWSGESMGLVTRIGPSVLAGMTVELSFALPNMEGSVRTPVQVRWVMQKKLLRFGVNFRGRLKPRVLAALNDFKWR